MKQSIAIDATHLEIAQGTGVELYVRELLPRLSALLVRAGVPVTWIGHSETGPATMPAGVDWLSSPHRNSWSQTALLECLDTLKPGLFFAPSGLSPLLYRGNTALTVHDLGAYLVPSAYTVSQQLVTRFLVRSLARRASCIVSPSQFTAGQVAVRWRIPLEKIAVTPLGLEPVSVTPEPVAGIDPSLPIVLYLGRIEARKNLLPLIRAAAACSGCQLVLAGKSGVGAEAVAALVASLSAGEQARIRLTGYVSDGQREWLYQSSALVVCPGNTEGFGLPLLEAFHHGLPALCAAAGSLPEVGGDAALYADPDDPADWQAQITAVLSDPGLRQTYAERGRERVKSYTWDRTAELTSAAFLTTLS
jgi:glycosyltransferase involved in cell wall biosynthesis